MSAYVVLIAVAVLALAGLVVDGGQALAARGDAAATAQFAARAAADTLTPDSLRHAGTPAVNQAGARKAAQAVLDAGGTTGDITVTADTVTVTAHAHRRTAVLSFLGIDQVTGTATATARILTGTTTGTRR